MTAIGHRIVSVTVDPAAKTLSLAWDDGSSSVKSLAALIGTRGVFKPLRSYFGGRPGTGQE